MKGHEPETKPVELAEDTVLATLFTTMNAQPEQREGDKLHRSSCNTNGEDALERKKEKMDLEAERRASLIDEENRLIRARELDAGASSLRLETVERSTTEGP